ncbi:MAG TPA: hypothetical protein DEQ34_05310 [Balneolaceae bacterium]|nr:hypothetical protein [Balneolaceae bacterium]|tara:strand:- start:15692 stop:17581 length:1890 start_codon:yes stop_codon:yes gene_type:complete
MEREKVHIHVHNCEPVIVEQLFESVSDRLLKLNVTESADKNTFLDALRYPVDLIVFNCDQNIVNSTSLLELSRKFKPESSIILLYDADFGDNEIRLLDQFNINDIIAPDDQKRMNFAFIRELKLIKERNGFQKQIEESDNRLTQITAELDSAIIRCEVENGTSTPIFVSPKIQDIYEITSDEVLENSDYIWNQILKEDYPLVRAVIDDATQSLSSFDIDFRIQTPTGNIKWVEVAGTVSVKDNMSSYMDIIHKDVTNQRIIEHQVRVNETYLQSITNNIPGAILKYVFYDNDTDEIHYISDGVTEVFEVTPEEAKADTQSIWKLVHPDDKERVFRSLKACAITLTKWNYVFRITTKSGKLKWIKGMGTPTKVRRDSVNYDTALLDVTKEKEYELSLMEMNEYLVETKDKLKDSLEEKVILLSEIHHRVKNNLAIVSGLLELQAMDTSDETVETTLHDMAHRIQSIAGVHELLYDSKNFSDISFHSYIKKLLKNIGNTANGKKEVELIVDVDESITVNINQAVPLGLLLNELVTNSFKYAFKNVDNPQIIFKITVEEDDIYTVEYSDNGPGFNIDKYENPSSLGFTLIRTLFTQLHAEVHFEDDKSLPITFSFRNQIAGSQSALRREVVQ